MLIVEREWVWDFWVADDGDAYHLFFLHAPKSLGDERHRHRQARIGHAISTDLTRWSVIGDVFGPGDADAFDATATWTGSVVRNDDGLWYMFYTGARFLEEPPGTPNIETVGLATSPDLMTWTKHSDLAIRADARWYELLDLAVWREEAWRDPWVYRQSDGWHMLITARSARGAPDNRGVLAHATSPDLTTWTIGPPFTGPGLGFANLEVPQLVTAPSGEQSILFSCPSEDLAHDFSETGSTQGGIWTMRLNPNETASQARLLTNDQYYSGRIISDRAGDPKLLAVVNAGPSGFVGCISDPMPLTFDDDGLPKLADPTDPLLTLPPQTRRGIE